jgi:hypothetical protein
LNMSLPKQNLADPISRNELGPSESQSRTLALELTSYIARV